MLPSLAIAVTLAADAMTDFWMEPIGAGKVERKPNKSVFFSKPRRWWFQYVFLNPASGKDPIVLKYF